MVKLIFTLLTFYLLLGLYFYLIQRSMIYFPREEVSHPFKEFVVKSGDESIHVIAVNEGKEEAIIYFGGNAEAAGYSAHAYQGFFPEHTLYFVNYRGYGKSSGTPTQDGLYSDALHVYDAIKEKHTVVHAAGRSLGSSIATYLAANREIGKLALITPFDSIEHIAKDQLPFYPVSWFLKDRYDSVSNVSLINAEYVMVLAAEKDSIIKPKYTAKLIDAFEDRKIEVEVIKDKGHNSISNDTRYYEVLRRFFGKMAP